MTHPALFTRRSALKFGLKLGLGLGLTAGACACFFPARLLAASPKPDFKPDPKRAQRLAQGFAGVTQGAQAWLTQAVGPQEATAVGRACPAALAALLPRVPDIGPANRNEVSLEEAVWLAALTRAMRARKLPEAMAGRLFYDLCEQEMAEQLATPATAQALAEAGAALFGPAGREDLLTWTRETQKRRHPADWVGKAVLGDGQDFDLGYDYSQCGAVKYFKANGVEKVAPYFCLNDFSMSKAMGTGLARVHTIGQGDGLCDFRYKQGRPVTQSWETEAARIGARRA
jgi:hypothetical protein